MKISFISFECPPDAAYGGIGTYVYQAAKMMHQRGHHVEVFSSSPDREGCFIEDGFTVHRILEEDYLRFGERIAPVWAKRHEEIKFDVLEGPEYGADARVAVHLVPDIPLVVKLHTPTFMTAQGTFEAMPFFHPFRYKMLSEEWKARLKYYLFTITQREIPSWRYTNYFEVATERNHTLQADVIVAPSREIGQKLTKQWCLDSDKIMYFPYPYIPDPALLSIPVDSHTNTITFLGRIEVRKGVLDLAKAIPIICEKFSKVKFRFVGSVEFSPRRDLNMKQFLELKLQSYLSYTEFVSSVPLAQIPQIMATTDVCIFPSIWDNFPNVCLEAMSAARGVVGTNAGGMAEMLDENRVGRLVPPRSPHKIAAAVLELLENPDLRMELGRKARQRILDVYNLEKVGVSQEASYKTAIARRKQLGPRF
ncbi:glycosyltransferase family 4 protein [Trichothermofontia sp.]